MNGLNEGVVYFSIVLGLFSFILSLVSLILTVAQKLSTHKIEWRPLEVKEMEYKEDKNDEDDEELLAKVRRLQEEARQRSKDPMNDITETSNF